MTHRLTNFNWSLLVVTSLILLIGVVNLYSAVYYWGEEGQSSLFWSQLLWILIGLVVMFMANFSDYKLFHRFATYIYVAANLLLIFSLIFGKAVKGTYGWIQIWGFSFQPAEFAKIAFVIAISKFYSEHPEPDGFSLLDLLRPIAIMALPFMLVILQGDMGSSLFFLLIFVSVALFAKIKTSSIVFLLIVGLIAGGVTYQFGLKEYQRSRILNFLNPEQDVRNTGYHLVQSKIAVGSGKIFGKGYLNGNINKLRYLPERHTDFIFPVFAEEWGFVGSFFLISLYLTLLLMGVEIATKTRDRFGILLTVGIISMFFWQIAINLGGVLGLMPLTGVTLPLMSYGGSSMVVILGCIGIVGNISRKRFIF